MPCGCCSSNYNALSMSEVHQYELKGNDVDFPEIEHSYFGTYFKNPWPEWRFPLNFDTFWRLVWKREGRVPNHLPPDDEQLLNEQLPVTTYESADDFSKLLHPPKKGIQFVWVGHATCLVQIDGITALTDPVFAERVGPPGVNRCGPRRYRPLPFTIRQLKSRGVSIDAVVISHNHYDHLDSESVHQLNMLYGQEISWFCPMGLADWLRSCGCEHVTQLLWWQYAKLETRTNSAKIVCVPAQHWSLRTGFFDKNKSLWSGWVIEGCAHRFYFAGDTGYNNRVFKQIGSVFAKPGSSHSFDLAAIPIGSYLPRYFMQAQHIGPREAVMVHNEIMSAKSIAIHWGTFERMGFEHYLGPSNDLLEEVQLQGLHNESKFIALHHGDLVSTSSGESGSSQDEEKGSSLNEPC